MELLAIFGVFFIIGAIGFRRSLHILLKLALFGALIVFVLSVLLHL